MESRSKDNSLERTKKTGMQAVFSVGLDNNGALQTHYDISFIELGLESML
jgi:hypothetical protein